MYISFTVAENQGGRPYMEDRFCIEKDVYQGWSLFAVFDGHGGHYVSHFLKFHFKDILRDTMLNCKSEDSLEHCIKETFKKISLQLDLDKSMNCGSTVCALLLKGKEAIFINTGDSRVVCGDKDKNIVYQSIDHKPDHPDEVKRIKDAGGFVFPLYGVWRVNGNLALSRSVGDLSMFPHIINTPDIKKVDLPDNVHIIIGTDGIWDVIESQEAVDLVVDHNVSANVLLAKAHYKGSLDNLTAIIIRASSEKPT